MFVSDEVISRDSPHELGEGASSPTKSDIEVASQPNTGPLQGVEYQSHTAKPKMRDSESGFASHTRDSSEQYG
jgi:hypothetical protein